MDNTLLELLNVEFVFKFAGKNYSVRKANLKQGILYQQRIKELVADDSAGVDLRLAAYAIYLVLKEHDPSTTEDFVLDNTPAELDVPKILGALGFMSPSQAAAIAVKEETK